MTRPRAPNTNAEAESLVLLLRAVGTMVHAQSAKEAKEAAKAVVEEWRALEGMVRE